MLLVMSTFVSVSEPALAIAPPLAAELPAVAERPLMAAVAPASTWKTLDRLFPERVS